MKLHWYELKLRPPGPGCQPQGLIAIKYNVSKHGVVGYDRELTDAELAEYELAEWEDI